MKRCSMVLGKYRSRSGYPVTCYVNWEGTRVCVSAGVFVSDPSHLEGRTVSRREVVTVRAAKRWAARFASCGFAQHGT